MDFAVCQATCAIGKVLPSLKIFRARDLRLYQKHLEAVARTMTDDLRQILEQLQAGRLSVDAAIKQWNSAAMADLGYAHVDLHRRQRCGFPEVIFCEGKTCEWVEGVVRKLVEAKQDCLATRVSEEQAVHLGRVFPEGRQDRIGRIFWLPAEPPCPPKGKVLILTAGTSDLPVAREALMTVQALGCEAILIADVGVAGIYRFLRPPPEFGGADAHGVG